VIVASQGAAACLLDGDFHGKDQIVLGAVGKCGQVGLVEKLVCVDGPVFSMSEVGGLLESFL
jgi:NAD(P)H-flavin reductase